MRSSRYYPAGSDSFAANRPTAGRVLVAGIEEVRGRTFDVVFLPGLVEGLAPRRTLEDPLLLDVSRASLSNGLAFREDRVMAERQLLHVAGGAATKHLIVSFPNMDLTQGRSRVPKAIPWLP